MLLISTNILAVLYCDHQCPRAYVDAIRKLMIIIALDLKASRSYLLGQRVSHSIFGQRPQSNPSAAERRDPEISILQRLGITRPHMCSIKL
jgi:hypothetical protein